MHAILRRFGSPRLAAWLIAALIVMNLLSVLIPQRIILGESFDTFAKDSPLLAGVTNLSGLDRVFTGWPIVVVSLLLVVNVTACTALRLMRRRTLTVPRFAHTDDSLPLSGWDNPTGYLDAAASELGSRPWHVVATSDTGFVAAAGRLGFWGSMLLHASILVLIVGGALTAMTSFRGEMVIVDGESVVDSREAYDTIPGLPLIGPEFSGTRLTLDSTEIKYDSAQIVSAIAQMRGIDTSGRIVNKDVRVNHPLDVGGRSFLILNSGYAVAVTIDTSATGAVPRVVSLGEETPYGWRDRIDLPPTVDGQPAQLRFLATPVPVAEGAPIPAEKFDLADPRLRAKLVVAEETVWEGEFAPGQRRVMGDGIALTFDGLRLWDRFLVRGEPARWVTYVGFWMAVIGAAVRFLLPERRIAVVTGSLDDVPCVNVSYRVRPWSAFEAASDARLQARLVGLADATGTAAHAGLSSEPNGTESS